MRIILLIRSLQVGGAERQLCVLARGLHHSGHSVAVAVFYENGPLEADLHESGVAVIQLKRKGRWDIIPFFFRLVALIKEQKPDILHSYLQVANIWAVIVKLVLPGTKIVWGLRSSDIGINQYDRLTRLTDLAESRLARIPDWIICNSRAGMLHAVNKGFPGKRISVIPNGIDTMRFFAERELGRSLRNNWGVKEGQKLIGIVGRLDPLKDYPGFLRACSRVLAEKPDARFVCVGDGPSGLLIEYQKLASSLNLGGHLSWAGSQAEMLNVYNALDMLVSSSTSEGFSNVVAEAMACGVPCVVTDVGDSGLLVADVGEIVKPRDPQALKNGMCTMLNRLENDTTNLSVLCRQRILDEFSVPIMVGRTVETLKQMV
jgi:glycosyltransferase involved in cell wall biosynthesis